MSNPCEWCRSTSEQIDSLEYQTEQQAARIKELEAENETIKALLGEVEACPHCFDGEKNVGGFYDGYVEGYQCQWCDEKEQALKEQSHE
jgi:glutaredoxin